MKQILTTAIFLIGPAAAFAQDETIGVRLREWYVKMEGEVESDGATLNAGEIDLDATLGLDDRETAHEIQAYVDFPILGKFYAGAWWVRSEGDHTLNQNVTFDDQTFTASTTVESEIDLKCYYASYEFSFPVIPLGDLISAEVGILAGVRVLDVAGSIQAAGQSASDEGIIGTPVVGVHGSVRILEWIRADAEIMGLGLSYSGRSGRYIEAYGEVVVTPAPWVFAGVGYKYVDVFVKEENDPQQFEIDITLSGFYLTAGVRF